ncbi:hypothetical protein [Streptomyces sp. NPDC060054]|uniref:hypothetical protein n=1 Tax=Streptomyces sp. NPDC060054 TaxID=3347048 RepID=UPI000AA2D440
MPAPTSKHSPAASASSEQRILDLRSELAEHDEDLAAAWAANRDLMAQLHR